MSEKIVESSVSASGIKLAIFKDGKEIARAFLYIMTNDLHKEPFGFMEDVFVEKEYRHGGFGTILVNRLIEIAKERGCYKLLGTSRHERSKVHELYTSLGFENHGFEFRITL